MRWLDAARARLRLLLARRGAESRMQREFGFHIDMETERLMRERGLGRPRPAGACRCVAHCGSNPPKH